MGNDDGSRQSESARFEALLREIVRATPAAPIVAPDLVGITLDHYRVLAALGRGGMGVVYRARDERLGREVALKVLSPAITGSAERRLRFVREAKYAAAVNHPNIATIHEAGEAEGHVFIVMELVDGDTLRSRLTAGALPVPEAVRIARGIVRGLAKAHEKGIVHRDLKPENVMITRDGEVKLLDFGLAKLKMGAVTPSEMEQQPTESRVTQEGQILGTPSYMSPEQAAGKAVDARSDVFSLGVTLYEMVTGVRPFAAATTAETVAAILRDHPAAPSRRNAKVGASLERVISKALQKNPAERFASAADLLAALDACETGEARRRRALPALAIVVVAVALGGGYWALRGRAAPTRAASTSAPATSSSGQPRALTMFDLPAPPTQVPEAAHEYALGMGALHDDNSSAAVEHFERVVQLDPTMAAGHLRLAIANYAATASPERIRAEFARAAELRTQLTERDQALMNALEPLMYRAQPDITETIRRVEAMSERNPLDVELYDWLGWLHGSMPESLPDVRRAIALDPTDANALQIQGHALGVEWKLDEARASFEQCTAVSLTTSDCLASEAWTDMLAGRCADFEGDARRLVPRSPLYGHVWLMSALVATGHPDAAVREERGLLLDAMPESDRKLAGLALDTQLALIAGDFVSVRALVAQQGAALAAHATARSERPVHYRLAMQQLTAALESGDTAGASLLAQDFVARSGSWIPFTLFNSGVDLSVFIARQAPGDLEATRREQMDRWFGARAYRGLVWPYAYAAAASTPEEARAALDAIPAYEPLTSYVVSAWLFLGELGLPDAATGHTYMLAGRAPEALPYLERAVAACADFDAPLTHTRAELELGIALEQTGDKAGACAAYGKVLDRWGHAKPRSITADAARTRAAALGCSAR